MKSIILLTACVTPNGMTKTALQDSNVRLNQYIKAIQFYLLNTKYNICICENSNTDLSLYFKDSIANNRLEFLVYKGNHFDKSKGKGYGEAEIIQYAIEHSQIIDKNTRIIKITGRYIVNNITKEIEYIENLNIKKNTKAFIFTNDIRYYFCNSFFFIAPVTFFSEYFLKHKNKIDDSQGFNFENLLFEELVYYSNIYNKKIIIPPYPLEIDAISGSSGKKYRALTKIDYIRSLYLNIITQKIPILILFLKLKFFCFRFIKRAIYKY